MNYVSKENMADILDGIARKIGSSGSGIQDWTENTEYKVKNLVIYNDIIYQCIVANTDSAFTENHWKEIGNGGVTEWQSNKIYEVNDLVIHNSDLYLCVARHTSDATFDSSKWKNLSSSSQEINYSTEEQQIGTWIDGKPLYQKTYVISIPDEVGRLEVASLPTGVSSTDVVEFTDTLLRSDNTITKSQYIEQFTDGYSVWIRSNNKIVFLNVGEPYNGTLYLTIKYTKTTDGGGT